MTDWFDAENHATRALEMFERGRWAEAEMELRKALAFHPDQPEWLYHLGVILESSGRDRQAKAMFEQAAELSPEQVDVVVSAANVCARLGEPARSLHWLDRVLAIDPSNEEAHARCIEMLVVQGRHEEAETAFYLAEMAMDSASPMCLLEISVSLIARGKYRKAGWCLREAMKMEPGLPRIRLRLAEVHASTGRLDRALQLCGREVREDPGNIDALSLYAELLESSGRNSEAIETLRRILDFEPADLPARQGLARLLNRMGHPQRSLVEWQILRKLDSNHHGVDIEIGEVLMQLDRSAEARISLLLAHEQACDQLEHLGADQVELSRLSSMLLDAHLADEAVVLMEAAYEVAPDDPETLRLLALARYGSGDSRGGMTISRRIIRLDPGCQISMHNLALAALQRGRLRVSWEWVRRGLKRYPGNDGLRRIRLRILFDATAGRFHKWLERCLSEKT